MKPGLLFCMMLIAWAAIAGRPNVIIIFTDDQGSVDMNIYGSEDLHTPHMDKLARSGTRFTQFYSAAPVCSPSRVGLLTGRTPQHGGLEGNVPPGSPGMPSEQVTLAEELKKAGYATAHIGKWHLGHSEATLPNGQGFDYSFGHHLGCIDNYSHFFYWNGPNRHDLWRNDEEVFHDGEFFPELMVREASTFIENHADEPFFIYFAMNTPHYPYQGSVKWLEHYKDLPYPRNLYTAFLSTMDEYIGKLLHQVKTHGLEENTIIVFQSDHGASEEIRAHSGGGNSGPYRGSKFTHYEGGLRVPAIISWPGTLPKNQVRDQMATGCDWYPTLLELCELPPADHKLDGKSLLPVIKSAEAETPHREFHWQSNKSTTIRAGDLKLILSKNKSELYNIPADPGETNNLFESEPETAERLGKLSRTYWDSLLKN